jgi:hypothetical protein
VGLVPRLDQPVAVNRHGPDQLRGKGAENGLTEILQGRSKELNIQCPVIVQRSREGVRFPLERDSSQANKCIRVLGTQLANGDRERRSQALIPGLSVEAAGQDVGMQSAAVLCLPPVGIVDGDKLDIRRDLVLNPKGVGQEDQGTIGTGSRTGFPHRIPRGQFRGKKALQLRTERVHGDFDRVL